MNKSTKNYSRRKFIKLASCGVVAASIGGIVGCASPDRPRRIPPGLQLYSVRHELAEDKTAVIGEDELNWEGILHAAEDTGGIKWYILEYEIEGVPPLGALSESLQNLMQLRA